MNRTVRPGILAGELRAPPSKSYTHRALLAAHFSRGRCRILDPLDSDDTRATARGIAALGSRVTFARRSWEVRPAPARSARPVTIDLGESGTSFRLLVAAAALGPRPVRFVGAPRLAERPIGELYRVLRELGADIRAGREGRGLPAEVRGPIGPGRVDLRVDESSQFLSALLLALPCVSGRSAIRLLGRPVSQPYVDATHEVLRHYGVRVSRRGPTYTLDGPQRFAPRAFVVPGDASSAACFWAGAALTGGSVTVRGIDPRWPQADLRILPMIERMGGRVRRRGATVTVLGPLVRGARMDLTPSPDLYPLVGVLAALAPNSTSVLRGAAHVRLKESDRRIATLRLTRSLGARVRSSPGALRISSAPSPRALRGFHSPDHRVVMAAAVAALRAPGASRIGDAASVRKSYPGFWSALEPMVRARSPPR